MKHKKLIILPVLAFFAMGSYAQLVEQAQTVKAKNNWFISFGVGPNLLMGEQDRDVDLIKRISYSGELSAGKWFSPYLGARLQITGGQAKGFNYLNERGGYYTRSDRSISSEPMTLPPPRFV